MLPEQASEDRQVRAGRNQSMFRSVNEHAKELNEAFSTLTHAYSIACECADTTCIQRVEISREDYDRAREEPTRFVVLPGHVYPDVENVVEESPRFAVVEKLDRAADVARERA